MEIVKKFISGCVNRPNRKLFGIRGLVIHWIGASQSSALVIRNNFQNSKSYGATQYVIDYNTGLIIQTMPEDEETFHVGNDTYTALKNKICGNTNPNKFLVGIECCISDLDKIYDDYSSKSKYLDLGKPSEIQYKSLVEFAADFLKRHKLTTNDLYRHYDITGKPCHVYYFKHQNKWEQFKQDVKNKMLGVEILNKYSYDDTINSLIEKGIIKGSDNMAYWEKVLAGTEPLNTSYLRTLLNRCIEKI